MSQEPIQLKISEDSEIAYLYLPDHPKKQVAGLVKRQIRLSDLVSDYKGPVIYLDFDQSGAIVGIEIT